MVNHVVVAHRVGKGGRGVAGHRVPGHGGAGVVGRKRLGESPPAPRAAGVEPVQVRDVAVARIRDHGRREERTRLPRGQAGQEAVQPGSEGRARKELGHELGLGQGRRQEVEPGRLPGARVVAIGRVPALAHADHGIEQAGLACRRPVACTGKRQGDRERAVRVDAVANRVRGEREPAEEVALQRLPERIEAGRPATRVRVVPGGQLVDQRQAPSPAVRPLAVPVVRVRDEAGLGGERRGGEA